METTMMENTLPAVKEVRKKDTEVRIAIVEDDPMFRHAMECYLNKLPGNRVYSFDSGESCFRHYHLIDPEILILDYRLNENSEAGGMDGLDILHEVKSVHPAIEVIFVSGQESFEVATAAIKGGASDYIIKDDKALKNMLDDVARISTDIRSRRERSRILTWIFVIAAFTLGVLLFASLTDYTGATGPLKILLVAAAAAFVVVALFPERKKKRKQGLSTGFFHSRKERPGMWVD
ncbi:MAG TPA: response regulator [Bacteroidia bacterium]|nr:response regulator [Bacteroidia bacterium]